jgi:hypothetical protein
MVRDLRLEEKKMGVGDAAKALLIHGHIYPWITKKRKKMSRIQSILSFQDISSISTFLSFFYLSVDNNNPSPS